MEVFRQQLVVLRQLFRGLHSEEQQFALSLIRDFVSECQYNDAMRSVAAMAESMIQETYGIHSLAGTSDIGPPVISSQPPLIPESLTSPPYIPPHENSMDSTDLLTNVLFETLRKEQQFANSEPEVTTFQPISEPAEALCAPAENFAENQQTENLDLLAEVSSTKRCKKKFRKCKFCELKFGNLRRYFCHRKIHAKPKIACALCGKIVKNWKSYSGHLSKIHNKGKVMKELVNNYASKDANSMKQKLLKCPDCAYVANFRQNLHRHRRKLHSNHPDSKKENCKICGKNLSSKWALAEHVAYVHSKGEKNFKCQFCPKSFVLKKDLNRHVKTTHESVRKFACHVHGCCKSYKSASHLKRHVLSAHVIVNLHKTH